MVLNDVLQLFVIVGGTVGITFQIAMVSFPLAKESIRMTAQVWESGAVISYCYGSL